MKAFFRGITWGCLACALRVLPADLTLPFAVPRDDASQFGRVDSLERRDAFWKGPAAEDFLTGSASSPSRLAGASDTRSRVFRLIESPSRNVADLLEPIREKYRLPALAVVVIRSNAVVGIGAVGQRNWNVRGSVTEQDKWHHGSITKSMTATLAALLVQEGRLRWSTTLGEVFPDKAPRMHALWRTVTLEQLLSHRAGAPDTDWLNENGIWSKIWTFSGSPRDARTYFLDQVIPQAPQASPGSQYRYSNAGYVFAGAMLEKLMNRAWEDLITERLFHPLGMTSAGFGAPASRQQMDQPWGHVVVRGVPSPRAPGIDADNPPAIGPAGTVHCTALDLAKYLAMHLAGARGESGLLLSPESFAKLHGDPEGDGYALGWNVGPRDWAKGRTLSHTGTNLQWFTNIWLAPEQNWACLVVTNVGGDDAFTATDQVVAAMVRQFL